MTNETHSSLQDALTAAADGFRFRAELSLEPLIRFWTECTSETTLDAMIGRLIRERLEKAPELRGAIENPESLAAHADLVDVLMAAVFPPAAWENEYGAALLPFQMGNFYATPAAERDLFDADRRLRGRVNYDDATIATLRRQFAYKMILKRGYDLDVDFDYTIILSARCCDTDLERHYRVEFDGRFVDVDAAGGFPALSQTQKERIARHEVSLDVVAQLLPPERFTFRGFTVFRAHDVTDQEVLSSLKRDLIDKESIVSHARFEGLQAKLRTFFRRPELRLGLAAVNGDQVLVLNSGARLEHSCIFADSRHHKTREFLGSIYERAFKSGQSVIVHDLATHPGRTPVEDRILQSGARNIVVAPLHYQDRVIGTLELDSPVVGDLNAACLPKLGEVLPLFAVAVQRSMDELNNRVQAIIKEKCTAIHPTVEWRFRRAVLGGIERYAEQQGGENGPMEMEGIVFERVHPLYGLADIRGSSTQRALAIQSDLLAQLRLAREVVGGAYGKRALPALDELRYRIDGHLDQITRGLRSGDEVSVTGFLRTEVEPLFEHLHAFDGVVRDRIETYRATLDPRLGTVYAERRRFEESVTRIAESVSSYLDLEQQTAQGMAPHYFEKQKTDGVDYQIYVGPSLQEDGQLDPLSLRNLRLWQLMVTCGIALRADRLKRELPVPLETTHLVLVQHTPLAIRFRFDEKRFDGDGAYDIRYEIVKKRIDKALIRGTTERVTQPGRIAIVYSQADEAREYRRYLDYLLALGYLTPGVEELELEELQGVHGLRALRVGVDLTSPRPARPVSAADVRATS